MSWSEYKQAARSDRPSSGGQCHCVQTGANTLATKHTLPVMFIHSFVFHSNNPSLYVMYMYPIMRPGGPVHAARSKYVYLTYIYVIPSRPMIKQYDNWKKRAEMQIAAEEYDGTSTVRRW